MHTLELIFLYNNKVQNCLLTMIFVFNIDSESLINPEELCYDDEILNKNIIYPIYTMMPMIPFPKNWYELNDNLDRLHPELFDEANWKIINNCNC